MVPKSLMPALTQESLSGCCFQVGPGNKEDYWPVISGSKAHEVGCVCRDGRFGSSSVGARIKCTHKAVRRPVRQLHPSGASQGNATLLFKRN